jgi:hypothetical protein
MSSQTLIEFSGHGGTEHPLKATLVVELLIEMCTFCIKLKGFKTKQQLDKMKEDYDIDLVEAISKVRSLIFSF